MVAGKDFPDSIPLSPEAINAGDENEVKLLIMGREYRYWEEVSINLTYDQIANTFSFKSPFFPDNEAMRDIFRPFAYRECAVYIGGQKILTGHTNIIKPDHDDKSCTVTVEGCSRTGVLNDCVPSPGTWPLSFRGLNLMQIAKKLCEPYSIDVVFEIDPGPAFTGREHVEIDEDKKIYDILKEFARLRGFCFSANIHGDLIFKSSEFPRATVTLEAGKFPVKKIDGTYNGQQRFSDITMVKSNSGRGSGQKITVRDDELVKNHAFRATIEKADKTEAGNLTQAANTKLGRTIAESVELNVDCVGWRRPDGELFQDGQTVSLLAPGAMIYKATDFVIRNVRLDRKGNDMTSSLSLCLPAVFNGAIPTEMPWAL